MNNFAVVLFLAGLLLIFCTDPGVARSQWTESECESNLLTLANLSGRLNVHNKQAIKKACYIMKRFKEDCLSYVPSSDIQSIKDSYETSCGSPEVQKWMNSSGSVRAGGAISAVIVLLIAVFM